MSPASNLDPVEFLKLVNTGVKTHLLEDIEARLKEGRGFTLATLNLDHIVKLQRDPAFLKAYQNHSHIVADGNPIVWLRHRMNAPVELIPGSELIRPLSSLACRTKRPIALLGSTEDTLNAAAKKLETENPGLEVIIQISPPFGFDPEGEAATQALSQINASGAAMCFLALGAPKQEILASRGGKIAPSCGFVSIGAGLDFIAGTQQRAPAWVQKIAMEWCWRIMSNPARLGKRYFECAALLPGLFRATSSLGR